MVLLAWNTFLILSWLPLVAGGFPENVRLVSKRGRRAMGVSTALYLFLWSQCFCFNAYFVFLIWYFYVTSRPVIFGWSVVYKFYINRFK